MKNFLVLLVFVTNIYAGCKNDSGVDDLRKEIEALKSTEIASVNSQITSIKSSISDLQKVDAELKGYIKTLQDALTAPDSEIDEKYASLQKDIEDLEKADAALEKRISDLKDYCDQQNSSTREWVTTTFTTLEQHSEVLEEIAAIKLQLGELGDSITNLDSSLSKKISDSEDKVMAAIGTTENSVKSWVNEQLTGYYTIAAADAKLKLLEDAYKAGDTSLAGDIKTLQESLNTAKSDLTAAYQKAIADAITENNGTINKKIADDIKAASDNLQSQINTINTRIDALESRVAVLEASVAELIGMVQSIVVVPDYSDGSVKMTSSSDNIIRFEVYPLSAAQALAEKGASVFSLDYIETQTKAGSLMNLPISEVSFDGEFVSIIADGSGVSENITDGLASANARLRISSGNVTKSSEYFQLTYMVQVYIPIAEISLFPSSSTIKVGESIILAATITPEDATNKAVIWSSSNDEIATVENGKVLGIAPGSVIITAKTVDGGKIATSGVTIVSDLPPSITFEADNVSAISAILKGKANLGSTASSDLMVGFQYSKSAGILPSNSITVEATDADAEYNYSACITGLELGTTYYFRSFVRQNGQDTYGETKEFMTKELASLIETNEASNIEATNATMNAKLDLTDVQYNGLEYGFLWGCSEDALNTNVSCNQITDNAISANLSGLAHKTQYWYKAYVTLDNQTFNGEIITFTTDVIPVESISLNKTEYTFHTIGNILNLQATVIPADATDKSIVWCSDNEDVATVDQNGLVKAIGNGTATIIVKTINQGKLASCEVVVSQWVTDITLDESAITLNEGESYTLIAMVNPDNADKKKLIWTSSDESIAKVDTEGKVTAVSKGTATIKARATDGSEKYGSCSVSVNRLVSSIKLDKTSLTLNRGSVDVTETITATITPYDASHTSVTWDSSNPDVASVSSSGVVTGKARGTATITVSANDGSGASATCEVEVKQCVTSITMDRNQVSLEVGESTTLSVIGILPDNANEKTYTWYSSDESIATVDLTGKVIAVKNGLATITAISNDGGGQFASCLINVGPILWSAILWSETWTGGEAGETPDVYGQEGTSVYGNGSVTYSVTSGDTATKLYNDNQMDGATTQLHLLLGKSGKTWTISGIPTGGATSATLKFYVNNGNTASAAGFTVTTSTEGVTLGDKTKGTEATKPFSFTYDITIDQNVSTFDLTFTNGVSSNIRLDDISVVVSI